MTNRSGAQFVGRKGGIDEYKQILEDINEKRVDRSQQSNQEENTDNQQNLESECQIDGVNSDDEEGIDDDDDNDNDGRFEEFELQRPQLARKSIHEYKKSGHCDQHLNRSKTSNILASGSTTRECRRFHWKYLFSILFLVIGLVIGYNGYNGTLQKLFFDDNHLIKKAMKEKLINETLQEISPIIPSIGNRIILDTIKKADSFSSDSSPLILLVIGNQRQQFQMHDVSKKLAELMTKMKSIDVRMETESGESFPIIQLNQSLTNDDIEKLYHQTFEVEKKPVLVLEHLERLSPSIAMTFHQYADKNQSRIHSLFTIMTYVSQLPDNIQKDITPKQIEQLSTKALTNLWEKHLSMEHMDCLINRVGERTLVLLT